MLDSQHQKLGFFWIIISLFIGALLYPLGERIVEEFFKRNLIVSLGERLFVPFEFDDTVSCLAGVREFSDKIGTKVHVTLFSDQDADVKIRGALISTLFEECNKANLNLSGGSSVYNFYIKNNTHKIAEDVTIFISDSVYLIDYMNEESLSIIPQKDVQKGYNLGDMPPGSSFNILISGRVFSDIFIQSSLGEDVVFARSFFSRWGLYISFSPLMFFLLYGLVVTLVRQRESKEPKDDLDDENNGQA